MRRLNNRLSRLTAVALLAGATGAAADSLPQGPLAERGTWALGFDLRSGEGSSFSLWRVRSPKTALGLEASLYWRLMESDYESPARSDRRYQRLCLEFRPTLKRYRPLRDGIAAYVYGQGLAGFWGTQREDRDDTVSRIDLGVGLGLGVDWFPLQRISVGGRTGLSMSYGFGESSRSSSLTGEVDTYLSTDRDLYLRAFVSKVTALVYF
ncbi:MAG: hypothetical protein OXG13_06230 [Gemmatimonadaceae bacterium]|nr:hypothetical protein [Gemmatimonadaceae bacterium]